jgi:molybdopterin-guanine dinucleotide biosynthesis protein A
MGGDKAVVELCGRPLISYPLEALRGIVDRVAVIAKSSTALPALPGIELWIEPDEPRHPLVGIVQALALCGDQPILACAADMPFVTPDLLQRLANTDLQGRPAAVCTCDRRLQPFPGLYAQQVAGPISAAIARGDARVTDEVAALQPVVVEVSEPETFLNLNAPWDVLQASALLGARRSASRRGSAS